MVRFLTLPQGCTQRVKAQIRRGNRRGEFLFLLTTLRHQVTMLIAFELHRSNVRLNDVSLLGRTAQTTTSITKSRS